MSGKRELEWRRNIAVSRIIVLRDGFYRIRIDSGAERVVV